MADETLDDSLPLPTTNMFFFLKQWFPKWRLITPGRNMRFFGG